MQFSFIIEYSWRVKMALKHRQHWSFYVLLDHFGFIESFCKWWCGRFVVYLIGSSWFILLPIFAGSVEAAMSETGSSYSNAQLDQVLNLQPEVSAQTGACSTSQRRKPRAQTKWPSDIIKVAGFDSEGFPTNDDGMKRWRLICGLIARQRVGLIAWQKEVICCGCRPDWNKR